jgi:adhesin/invasin
LYVSPTQINFQVPTELSAGQVVVTVAPSATSAVSAPLEVDPAAPGIFLQIEGDIRRAAAVNTDGSTNGPSKPAPAGGYIQMFLTGVDPVSPPIPTGQVAPLTPLSHARASVTGTIGPRVATVQFAGAGPLSILDQVNLQIPADLPPGDYPVVISVNGVQSNSALITVGPAVPK